MKNIFLVGIFGLMFILAFSGLVLAVSPSGASSATEGASSSATVNANPANATALAGNVTELTIIGDSTTQSWQGYYGNVSGSIQLADSNDHVMYNWSLAEPQGEVYSSTASSITWASIACYNVTADSLGVETTFNIGANDADGLNETFSTKNHDAFYTNDIEFTENNCSSVQLFDSSNSSTDGSFEEVVLWDTSALVFASILEDTSVNGFDGADHDFEMLVLDDGHSGNTDETTYYFYVELE